MYLTTFSQTAHSPAALYLSTNKCSVPHSHRLIEHVLLSGNRQQKEQYIWVLYQITEMVFCGKSMRPFFLDVTLHWFIDCFGYGLWEGLLGLIFYLGVEHNPIKAIVLPSAFCYQAQTMLPWQWKTGWFMFCIDAFHFVCWNTRIFFIMYPRTQS